MQFFDAEQTANALTPKDLIDTIQRFFVEGCTVPLRHNHAIQDDKGDEIGKFLIMPAWQTGKHFGVKTVAIFPKNSKQGLAGLHSVYTLYDATIGVPIAILDGNTITSKRTAAASALAARFLSREDSRRLLVVGAGQVGSLLPEMYKAVRPISNVSIYNPTHKNAQKLADQLQHDFEVQVVTDLKTAVEQADIISCATLSTKPLILRQWLQSGQHLDLIGSFTPQMRETEGKCFTDTRVFVDTEEALIKAGDILSAIKETDFTTEKVMATLSDLCQGKHQGRISPNEITVFKSVGTGLEDLAAASLVYDKLIVQSL